MASTIMVSAPGKVILHGEHAVVYGKAALATSVDLRCYVVLRQVGGAAVTLDLPDFNHHIQWSISTLHNLYTEPSNSQMKKLKELSGVDSESPATQDTATLVFLYLLSSVCREKLTDFEGLHVTVLSTLPASAGLGSSAAFSVSLSAAFLSLVAAISLRQPQNGSQLDTLDGGTVERGCVGVRVPESVVERLRLLGVCVTDCESVSGCTWNAGELELINEWGLKAEKLIHGTPSGIDNSVSTYGGAIRFCSGNIHCLQRMARVRILLVNTKVVRSTKKMVAGVRELHDKYPAVVGPVLESMEAIVGRAEDLLGQLTQLSPDTSEANSVHTALQELCEVNQHLLNAVGVGHPALDRVCAVARERGLTAKLTGAGGGGCAFIIIPPGYPEVKLSEVIEAFAEAGFESWETTIGSAGVTAHHFIT